MAAMTNYFFLRHIKECKIKLKDFDKPKTLRNEAKKYIDEFNNFLDSIDAENYSDFDDFNSRVKTFNEELNKILKANQIDNSDIISIFTNIYDNNEEVDIDDLEKKSEYFDYNDKWVVKA